MIGIKTRMTTVLAWLAAALLCQFCILGITSLFAQAGDLSRSFLFGLAEMVGVGGVVCGLMGRILSAWAQPSRIKPVFSFISGATFAAVMISAFRLVSTLVPSSSVRLAMDIPIAVALGAASYFLAIGISRKLDAGSNGQMT